MAKKVLIALCVFFLLPVILLGGCSEQKESKSLVTSFTADYTAQYKDLTLKGSVTTNRQSVTNISITYPDTVSGLNINYKGSEMEISRDTLICSADEAYLPQRSFPSILKSILNAVGEGRANLVSQDENESTYNLKTELGNCELTADENGFLTQANLNTYEFSIEFSENKSVDN